MTPAIVDRDLKPANAPTNDDVLTVPEAMSLLKISRDSIYAGCADRSIPHKRIGRCIRFSRAALMRWLEECGPGEAQEGQR